MLKEFSEIQKIMQVLRGPQFDREQHGSLFDRGSADSYYGRGRDPHWYPEGTGNGIKVTNLTPAELDEYHAGYDWNEKFGAQKSWT